MNDPPALTFQEQVRDRVAGWPNGHDLPPGDPEAVVAHYVWAADVLAEMARRRWPDLAPRRPHLELVARGALAAAADEYRGDGERFLEFASPYVVRAILRALGYPEPLPPRPPARAPAGDTRPGPGTGTRRRRSLRPAWVSGAVVGLAFALVAALLVGAYWKVGRLESERARGSISFSGGGVTATLNLTSGAGRPELWAYDLMLAEYSAWDSTLVVDGVPRSLWDHYFNYSVNRAARRAVVTIQGENDAYQLEQVIEIVDGEVRIEWFFVALRPIQLVELTVGHFNWYWLGAWREGPKVVVLATELDRATLEAGVRPERARRVEVVVGDATATAGYAAADLVNYFDTRYELRRPDVGVRVPLAREVVRLGPLVSVGAGPGRVVPENGTTPIQRRPLPPSYQRNVGPGQEPFSDDGSGGFHG